MAAVEPPTTSVTLAKSLPALLQSPDDLSKLHLLRARLLKEKSQIDAKLNENVRTELERTKEGLRKLHEGRMMIGRLKEEMVEIEKGREEDVLGTSGGGGGGGSGHATPSKSLRGNVTPTISSNNQQPQPEDVFAKISKVAALHRSLSQTASMVHQLRSMSDKVNHLTLLLEADKTQSLGPCGPSPNLLIIHFQLTQLESFRNETLHQAKRSQTQSQSQPQSANTQRAEDDRRTLEKYFERLGDLTKEFEGWMWEIAGNVVDCARERNGGVVVRLLKIVEVEGREDQKAVGLRLMRKVVNTDSSANYRTMQANARVIKNHRHKLLEVLTKSIQRSFDDAEQRVGGDFLGFIDELSWVFQDLLRIEDEVVPLFPADYEIHKFYVKGYHKLLNESLRGIVASNPEASVLLRMHAWLKEYRQNMKDLEIPQEWMQPPLLEGKAQDLIEDYVKLIVTKIDEWTVNLMGTETKDFARRDAPPEADVDGMYGLNGAMILFQMINQQVDLAADSGQGAVLARVVSESGRVMKQTQVQWSRVLDIEYRKQIERPEDVPPGLVEYVIALANDQLKCADYAEALSARLEPLVSDKYKSVISEKINEAIDGFLDVAKKCTQILINLVFNDLKVVVKALFSPTWYTDALMSQIVETIKDYMEDYQGHLNPSIFDLLVEDMLVNFLTVYLNALGRVQSRGLRIPHALTRLKEDMRSSFDFFCRYKQPEDLQGDYEILDQILAMLGASPQMVFMDYWNFAQRHGPNMQFIEAVLRGRDDMDRQTVQEVLDTLRRKVREENLGEPEEPTIMVKVKGAEQGLLSNLGGLVEKAANFAAQANYR